MSSADPQYSKLAARILRIEVIGGALVAFAAFLGFRGNDIVTAATNLKEDVATLQRYAKSDEFKTVVATAVKTETTNQLGHIVDVKVKSGGLLLRNQRQHPETPTTSIECDPGMKPIGGGFDAQMSGVNVQTLYPDTESGKVVFAIDAPADLERDVTIQVYAACIRTN